MLVRDTFNHSCSVSILLDIELRNVRESVVASRGHGDMKTGFYGGSGAAIIGVKCGVKMTS